MAAQDDIIKKLVTTLDDAVNNFNAAIPGIQKEIANEVENLLRSLDIKADTIQAQVANMKKIASFESKIESILKKSNYPDSVKNFISTFNEVAIIQHQYFETLSDANKPSTLLDEIKKQNIGVTLDALTESGLNANLITPVKNLLLTNINQGGSFFEMSNQIRSFIAGGNTTDGALARYAKQTTVDSINSYSRQYMSALTSDLGLQWRMYVGALIGTSRAWCKACIKKKYLHVSEFQQLIAGDFPEFKEFDGQIYDKTGLPDGMKAGTNVFNLQNNCGGWQCDHAMIPISDGMVPVAIRNMV